MTAPHTCALCQVPILGGPAEQADRALAAGRLPPPDTGQVRPVLAQPARRPQHAQVSTLYKLTSSTGLIVIKHLRQNSKKSEISLSSPSVFII